MQGGGEQEKQAGDIPDGFWLQSKKMAPFSRKALILMVPMDAPPGPHRANLHQHAVPLVSWVV